MSKAIEEAKKFIEEINTSATYYDDIKIIFNKFIERLEKHPQEPSLEELLEEIQKKYKSGSITLRYEDKLSLPEPRWMAEYMDMDSNLAYMPIFGKTPREALLALKEKLTSNN